MSDKMSYEDVRRNAILVKGVDQYYEELRLLKEDLQFFSLYISRNRKSSFYFRVVPFQLDGMAFNDIYRAYGFCELYIERVYATFTVMKESIMDAYYESGKYDDDTVRSFYMYLKNELDLDMLDYISGFIGCSSGSEETIAHICKILSYKVSDGESDG